MLNIDNFKAYYCDNHNETTVTGQILDNGKTNINWSDIKDKLIRLTAKLTERYASDILYDIKGIEDDLTSGNIQNKTYLIGFRENGVDGEDWICECSPEELPSRYRTIWQVLTEVDDKDNIKMVLQRVRYGS